MLVALPFAPKDVYAERVLINWIGQLGGCAGHHALLVADAAVSSGDVLELLALARSVFDDASFVCTDAPQVGWPQACNWMWRTAAIEARKRQQAFLWLEPDAIPLKQGWADELERQYLKAGTPFFGCVLNSNQDRLPSRYLAGNAVYPANAIDVIGPPLEQKPHIAWDICSAEAVVPHAGNTSLIQHFWGEHNLPPTFQHTRQNNGGPRNVFTLGNIWKNALIFHRVKDGSLIRLLGGKAPHLVAHGGDVGDLIYGLPAMKVLGDCHLTLHWHPVREGFSPQKFAKIKPLLDLQPYLSGVTFQHERPPASLDMNKFRQWNWDTRRANRRESLAQSHLRCLGMPENVLQEPWLAVDQPTYIPGKKVVFHRSPRYRNQRFKWKDIHAAYASAAVFVGMPDEHKAFCEQVGPVDYHPTPDYLELARVIAGAVLFVGNQSCPYAIAEGLKVNAILEVCPGCEDCQFTRPNLQNDPRGAVRVYSLQELEQCAVR